MDIALLILVALVSIAVVTALRKGRLPLLILGFKRAVRNLQSIWLRLLLGFVLGGLIKVLVPSSLIAEWLGPASGLKGILIGSYVGLVVGGGPYITLPIIASIYAAGAGAGPIIAFLVSSPLVSLQGLLVWQIPFLGAKIALTRYAVGFFLPPLVGLAGGAVYQLISVA
ncbi:permease [Chloroflexota bacterium]